MGNKRFLILLFLVFALSFLLSGGMCLAEDGLSEEESISIMFFETDLREALKEVSLQSGVTIDRKSVV